MNLLQKLVEIRKSVPYLRKANKGHQFNYVSSSQALGSVRAKMDDLGVLLVMSIVGHSVREHVTAKGARWYLTEAEVQFTWHNADDPADTLGPIAWYAQGLDDAEKGPGKAATYAEKFFLLKAFNIATDKHDPDAFQDAMERRAARPHNGNGQAQQQSKPPAQQRPASSGGNGTTAAPAPGNGASYEPSPRAIERIKALLDIARQMPRTKRVQDGLQQALRDHDNGTLSAGAAGVLINKAKDALTQLGWTEPQAWIDARKARGKAKRDAKRTAPPEPAEPPLQEPPFDGAHAAGDLAREAVDRARAAAEGADDQAVEAAERAGMQEG